MKNKFLLLATIFITILGLSSCQKEKLGGDTDTELTVAEKQLIADYPQYDIKDVKWELKDSYEVATFAIQSKSAAPMLSVWYAVAGDTATRKLDVESHGTNIPSVIKPAFDLTKYADAKIWKIEDIELENRYDDIAIGKVYEMELENISNTKLEAELFFDAATGKLLFSKEELDADNNNDKFIVTAELQQAVKAIYADAIIIDASKSSDKIEVDIISNDEVANLEIEMYFTIAYRHISSEYDVEYGNMPNKFSAITTWFKTASNNFPEPSVSDELEVEIVVDLDYLVNDVKCSTIIKLEYEASNAKEYEVSFFLDVDNQILMAYHDIEVGKYTDGTFVLNQGNMSDGVGSLIFIGADGVLTDNVFYKENNEKLPNLASDLFISDGKLYIICQSGNLVVADATTLKLESKYSAELSDISRGFPSHLAVVGDDVFIRNNSAIHRFNLESKSVVTVEGTNHAAKNRMVVIDNKVYATVGSSVILLEEGKDAPSKTIPIPKGTEFNSLIKSDDGNLWISGSAYNFDTFTSENFIMKMDINTHEFESNIVSYNVGNSGKDHPYIGAAGDNIYFCSGVDVIHHNFADKNPETNTKVILKDLSTLTGYDKSKIVVYNGVGVDSKNNKLYLNVLKGFGLDYLVNSMLVFDIQGDKLELDVNYRDKTQLPNGFHFISDFNN